MQYPRFAVAMVLHKTCGRVVPLFCFALALAAASRHGVPWTLRFVHHLELGLSPRARLPSRECRVLGLTATAAWYLALWRVIVPLPSRRGSTCACGRVVLSFTVASLYFWSVLPRSRRCGAVGASSAPCLLALSVTGTCRALAFPTKASERARQVRHRKHPKN